MTFPSVKIFYTRASHPERFYVTVMEVLAGLKDSNFICGKTILELLIWKTLYSLYILASNCL